MTYSSEIEDLRLRLAESERVRRLLAEVVRNIRPHFRANGYLLREMDYALAASDALDGEGS